jgi:hypothetical protein
VLIALSIESKRGESPRRRTARRGEGLKPQSKILLCILCVGAVLAPASMCLAAVAAMPTLNIAPTCESEGRKAMALGNSSIEACKRSELEARRALGKKWPQYEGTDRTTCMGRISHGGPMSSCNRASNRFGTRARYAPPMPKAEATDGVGEGRVLKISI